MSLHFLRPAGLDALAVQGLKFGSGPALSPESEQNEALYGALVSELKAAHPGHLPLLQEHLKKVSRVSIHVCSLLSRYHLFSLPVILRTDVDRETTFPSNSITQPGGS